MFDYSVWALIGWTVLVAAFVVAAFAGPRWPVRLDEKHRPVLLVAMVVLCVVLSAIGDWAVGQARLPAKQGTVGRVSDAVYVGFQNLLQSGAVSGGDNLWLRMGRTAGMAVVVLVAYETTLRLFAERIRRRRLARSRGHVLVCGLGRIGKELVRELRMADEPTEVVVVERDPSNVHLALARQMGAEVLIGDVTDKNLLEEVRAEQARDVFIVTGSNEPNLEAALDVLRLMDGLAPGKPRPRVLVHLTKLELDGVLQMARQQFAKGQNIDVRSFNAVDRAIRKAIDGPVLDRRPGVGEVAHFVIVGFGHVGRQLTLRLAELAHFENLKRSRMTIVHRPDERPSVEAFKAMYPGLLSPTPLPWAPDPQYDLWSSGVSVADSNQPSHGDRGVTFVANGGFVEYGGGVTSDGFVDPLLAVCRNPDARVMVFICREDDEVDCAQSMMLREELDSRAGKTATPTIFAYVPRRPTLTEVVSKSPIRDHLILFGDCADSCTYDDLTLDPMHPLAAAIAEDFDRRSGQRPAEIRKFDERAAWERRSNLMAAAHLNIKLKVVGLKVVPRTSAARFGNNQISRQEETLVARMEHNRWMAERLLAGWSFGERSQPKRRLQLVDWENLPDNERTKDHDQVHRTIEFCNLNKTLQLVKA